MKALFSFVVTLLAAAAVMPATSMAQVVERTPVTYVAPMLTAVADPFRPPEHIGGAGNRGLEYADSDNQVVSAAASGYVSFAGPVAGRKVITIQHADGVRTTYTGLLEIWVVSGQTVNQHSGIALASTGFHFGARIRDHYLDPQILIDASEAEEQPRLLPPPDGD